MRPFLILALTTVIPAMGTTIDFEAQAAERGGNLTGISDSPLTIGIVTFTGGELLNAEVGLNADETGVYATQGLFGSGETNPVVISFASAISNFSVLVANGDDARTYTVTDNRGDTVTRSLASAGSLGAANFFLAGGDVTSVDISSANNNGWDFAIDDVTFTPATSTPEPESLFFLGGGLLVLVFLLRRESRIRFAVKNSSTRE